MFSGRSSTHPSIILRVSRHRPHLTRSGNTRAFLNARPVALRIGGAAVLFLYKILLVTTGLLVVGFFTGKAWAKGKTGREGEVLVFEDRFKEFDLNIWRHEITLSGGGHWQFEHSTNNRSNSWVEDGILYLRPTLTADTMGEDCVTGAISCTLDVWGLTPADQCTSNAFFGCSRTSNSGQREAINPVQSARISSVNSFDFTFGRVEVEAKLPRGDWLWPAIWMLPSVNSYGSWPSSGEIDIMESRGNAPGYCPNASCAGGNDVISSSLHWGPFTSLNRYSMTTGDFKLPVGRSFDEDFHTFGLYWSESGLYTYVDTEDQEVLRVDFNDTSFWERGGFQDLEGVVNPWKGRGNSAPFDQGFYLIMNVAVGGVGGFFPDGDDGDESKKPWKNSDGDAPLKFWEAREDWLPTWKENDAALQVTH
ncbi:unnamed protein product, partial [Discosporangium mesarthrocarpum]